MLYQLTSSGFRCFCPFYRGGCEQSPPQGSCFFSSLGADARRPPSFFTRRYRMPCSKKRDARGRLFFCDCSQVLLSVLPHTARKGECEGKPLRVSPLAFSHPPAGGHFCVAKVLLQKRKTPTWVSFFFGAGYGSRTRLNGLGSRCNTDIPTLQFTYRVIVAYRRQFCNRKLCRKGMNVLSRRIPIEKSLEGTL